MNYTLTEVANLKDVFVILNVWTSGAFCPAVVLITWFAVFAIVSGRNLVSSKPAIMSSFFASMLLSIIFSWLGLVDFSVVAVTVLGFVVGVFLP